MRAGMRGRSIRRMEEITEHFAETHGVLAVAAFGSNAERERFDDFSDLDFLVLVQPEAKTRVLEQAGRLEAIHPVDGMRIAYGDAVQLLFSDGVLCDFGVVTPDQFADFPHGEGQYLWKRADWAGIGLDASEPERPARDELTADALFHLYTGLLRALRGEEAAAFEEIQVAAAQRVFTLLQAESADAFSSLRRAERILDRDLLAAVMPGYGHSREAAGALLSHLSFAQDTPLYQAVFALLN
jgi:predicted nucleotidyltransferase